MIDPKLIDDLARRLGGSLPESLRSLREDLAGPASERPASDGPAEPPR